MSHPLVITLPPIPKALNPNGRGHWSKKAAAVKKARWESRMAVICACRTERREVPRFARATIDIVVYYKSAVPMDSDNVMASLKAAQDGIADAGVVANDRDIRMHPPTFVKVKAEPRIVLTISDALDKN